MIKEKLTLTVTKVANGYRIYNTLFEEYYNSISQVAKGVKESDFEVTLITFTLTKKEIKLLKKHRINIKYGGVGVWEKK